jgi:hypothetical protein
MEINNPIHNESVVDELVIVLYIPVLRGALRILYS